MTPDLKKHEVNKSDGYYDNDFQAYVIPVLAGSYHWTKDKNVAFTTMLGSCVSVCAFDRYAGVGGMNHFLLPQASDHENEKFSGSYRYGSAAIETLLNSLYARGAAKNGMTVKLFGGARVLKQGVSDTGKKNIAFAEDCLKREKMRIESNDTGGFAGRRIIFFPTTGRVLSRRIGDQSRINEIIAAEQKEMHRIIKKPETKDVELF